MAMRRDRLAFRAAYLVTCSMAAPNRRLADRDGVGSRCPIEKIVWEVGSSKSLYQFVNHNIFTLLLSMTPLEEQFRRLFMRCEANCLAEDQHYSGATFHIENFAAGEQLMLPAIHEGCAPGIDVTNICGRCELASRKYFLPRIAYACLPASPRTLKGLVCNSEVKP